MKKYLLLLSACLSFMAALAQSQNALDFDGIDDEITVPGASALIAGAAEMSITCWVYPTNANPMYPDFDGFAGFRNELDCDFYVMQVSPSSAIEARLRNSTGSFYTITYQGLTLNVWQHLAVTYDGSMLRLYVGGILSDSVAASGNILNTAEPFHIGTLPFGINPYWLTGQVDEISLFNRALTAAEIGCISQESVDPADPSCKLFYTCNQGIAGGVNTSITALEDQSGHIDGTFNAMSLAGPVSNFVTGINNAASSTYVMCQGDTYQFGTQLLTEAGYYYNSAPLNGGCGNLQELNLVIGVVDTAISVAAETLTANAAGAVYQWVDCNNGYAYINGETAQSFTPGANGSYALLITQNGCADTSSCYTITSVGIENLLFNASLTFSPVPVKDKLEVRMNSIASAEITIKDIAGKTVFVGRIDKSNSIIDAASWQPGIYFIEAKSGNAAGYWKLVKQ